MQLWQRIKGALLQRDSGQLAGTRTIGITRHAGVFVNQERALTFTAVWAAARVIAETLAMLPWTYHEELPSGGNRKLIKDPLYRVLKKQANPEMSAFTWKQVAVFHALMWGDSYSEIERNRMGDVVALWPMLPDRTTPMRQGRALVYEYNMGGAERVYLPADQVFHVRGLSFDGLKGLDVLTFLARTAAIGIAMDTFQASFFGNGTHVSGGLFHQKQLSKEAADRLRAQFEALYRGPGNAFRMGVFEEGLEWKSFQITPEAAEMIDAKKLTITDIARFFRLPPHKLADLERATFSNIEEQNQDFVTDTLQPWAVRFEQEADIKLVPPQYPNRYTKFGFQSLLRGRQKERYDSYHVARGDGWINGDEIRALEEMPPMPDGQGKVYLVPVNMQPIEFAMKPPEPKPAPGAPPAPGADPEDDPPEDPKPAPDPKKPRSEIDPVLRDTWGRITRRAAARVEQLLANDYEADDFAIRIAKFTEQHEEYTRGAVLPSCQAMADSLFDDQARGAAAAERAAARIAWRYVAGLRQQPRDPNTSAAEIEHWVLETKAAMIQEAT